MRTSCKERNALTHKKTHTNMGAERGRNRCRGTDMHAHSHFSVLTHSLNIRFVFGQTLNGPTSPQTKNPDPSLSLSSSSILSTLESTGPHCTTFSSLIPISCLSSCPSFRPHSFCLNDLSRRGSSWMGGRLSASHSSREPNPWTSKQNVTS